MEGGCAQVLGEVGEVLRDAGEKSCEDHVWDERYDESRYIWYIWKQL